MIEKWKQRAIHMNFKKAVILFLITCFVVMIAGPAALYGNFQDRIAVWEQVRETDGEHREGERTSRKDDEDSRKEEGFSRENDRDYWENDESDFGDRERERDSKERKEKGLEELNRYFHFSRSDFVLLSGCIVTAMALGVWYWILVMIWAYRKAWRMGINGRLAVLTALFFNLGAVAFLYLYEMLKGSCTNCGRVRRKNGMFCDRCGSPLKKECPQCGQEMDVPSAYCSNCGIKMDENEEAEEDEEGKEAEAEGKEAEAEAGEAEAEAGEAETEAEAVEKAEAEEAETEAEKAEAEKAEAVEKAEAEETKETEE